MVSPERRDASVRAQTALLRLTPKMVITPGRIAYLGLLGSPTVRCFGAISIYVSLGRPFALTLDGETRFSLCEIVGTDTPHQISSADRLMISILIEAETLESEFQIKDKRLLLDRITRGFAGDHESIRDCKDFDERFFGQTLPRRALDRRIARVARHICAFPAERHSASLYAEQAGLSISRFTHLFREQMGTTLRRFCAWKRARGVMAMVKDRESLVDTALSAGFADSTHFSHAIRQFFGLRPKDIIAGSRMLTVVHYQPFVDSPHVNL